MVHGIKMTLAAIILFVAALISYDCVASPARCQIVCYGAPCYFDDACQPGCACLRDEGDTVGRCVNI